MSTRHATPRRGHNRTTAEQRNRRNRTATQFDRRGQKKSPAVMPGFRKGKSPVTKGMTLDPEIYTIEEIVALLGACDTTTAAGRRLRASMCMLWRTGMRRQELIDLEYRDLQRDRSQVVIRHGKGDRRRIVPMDIWGWQQLDAWLEERNDLPGTHVFPVIKGVTVGLQWHPESLSSGIRQAGLRAGLKKRCHAHGWRHTYAVELWLDEGLPEYVIQQLLGHVRLDTTAAYLRRLAADKLFQPVIERKPPRMPIPLPTLAGRMP